MERRRDTKLRWKNFGFGKFMTRDKRTILPGQEFLADVQDIPVAFRKTIRPLDKVEEDLVPSVEVLYKVEKRGGSWYNVVDANGKIMNEKALTKVGAEEFVKKLEVRNG